MPVVSLAKVATSPAAAAGDFSTRVPFIYGKRLVSNRVSFGNSRRRSCSVRSELQSSRVLSSVTDLALDNSVENGHLPKGDSWAVHKFGGTCVGNSERIKDVADVVVKDDSERKLVVVSAMAKVTDMMYDLIHRAQSRDDSYLSALDAVLEKHRATAVELIDGDELSRFLVRLHDDINNLKAMLRAIYIAGHATESFSDFVVGHGELWSAQMLAAVVRKSGLDCTWMDARDVLVVIPVLCLILFCVSQTGMSQKLIGLTTLYAGHNNNSHRTSATPWRRITCRLQINVQRSQNKTRIRLGQHL